MKSHIFLELITYLHKIKNAYVEQTSMKSQSLPPCLKTYNFKYIFKDL